MSCFGSILRLLSQQVVIGCVIARICNTNDCLAGVVSQVSATKMGRSVGLVMGQNGYL
ncbi:hypothetical protein HanXRQr2_Chr14g0644421 [Helianthus annuus]|uniref:Uncharacterized protein n=1 Tax=Helianthus annuus TaxID=4232 RepID=A0A9K3E8Y3_HELAN|nr:hypothetical protein HanXRQr2_Chr14g0644421 [Helianthus annuus]KAJ0468644.1 hypothetical protein HanIR_Chr14g0698931 [Helianthus annuus]KAJ0659967.1 hypothetical protein HanOQP8_Chr14g0532241 [Helianthus annuus]KAJ0840406.1 hypothetical protein HanPSC8_Chr14g0618301 [Helianthus annuus]